MDNPLEILKNLNDSYEKLSIDIHNKGETYLIKRNIISWEKAKRECYEYTVKRLITLEEYNSKFQHSLNHIYKYEFEKFEFMHSTLLKKVSQLTQINNKNLGNYTPNGSRRLLNYLLNSYLELGYVLESIHQNLINFVPTESQFLSSKQKNEKRLPEQETPKTFDELFYKTELVTPCIDVLKELDPPLIDTDYNYIGNLKGIICVWIKELQRQGIIKHYSDRKIFATLISQKIKRFSIDESMFGKYQKKAEENYRTDIKTKVSKIKLSQNSQKGKLGK